LKQNKADWDKAKIKAFKNQVKIRKRLILSIAVVLNIGILAFLKYYNFFAGSLNDLLGSFGISMSVPSLRLFLPLGISFYTFQSVGYVVDVYREKI
jgi:D-alanyl-lipoteichoic acid acyltransferase DltB (MBOAT superfamily)